MLPELQSNVAYYFILYERSLFLLVCVLSFDSPLNISVISTVFI